MALCYSTSAFARALSSASTSDAVYINLIKCLILTLEEIFFLSVPYMSFLVKLGLQRDVGSGSIRASFSAYLK